MNRVMKLVRLLLVIPATNAISKRSFFSHALHQDVLKVNHVQGRLNATMFLHIHKDLTDNLDLESISKDFISKSHYRKSKFSFV